MTSQLKKIDARAAILTSLHDAGRLSTPRFLAAIAKLTERAAEIMARMGR